jgi:formate dehydrogenase subunit delta
MDENRLVTMANQIAAFFAVQGAGAEAAVADHIEKNWDPRMRAAIAAHVAAGGAGLSAVAKAALESISAPAA